MESIRTFWIRTQNVREVRSNTTTPTMTNFGPDKVKALADVRKVSTATDQPFGMFKYNENWWATPAAFLLHSDVDQLEDFQIIQPQEQEKQ